MPRPFRFAVQADMAGDGAAWRRLARSTEDLGYSTLCVRDHLGDQLGPLVALTVAAEATDALRVGPLVLGNDYRHPVVLAKELATLDLLSDGRLEVGLGAGWMTSDYEQSGIPLDSAGVRIERLVESVAILKSLWSTGEATLEGKHYRVTGAMGSPRTVQRPHPPLVIGGGGRRVLGVAGREADIVGVNPNLAAGVVGPEVIAGTAAEYYDQRVDWVRQAAGSRFDQLELQCLTFAVQVVPDRAAALERLAGALSRTPDEVAQSPAALVGSVAEIVDQLHERRDRWGFSYVVVHQPEMEAFAPVVAALAGA